MRNLSSLIVTAGTRVTTSAASESGVFEMLSAPSVSLIVGASLRFRSCVASVAAVTSATTSMTSTLLSTFGVRLALRRVVSPGATWTWSRTFPS